MPFSLYAYIMPRFYDINVYQTDHFNPDDDIRDDNKAAHRKRFVRMYHCACMIAHDGGMPFREA